ncbi:hypothetical protein KSC_074710 [Ktedonobacter sp. SOSP1-52]|uniref:hypothetical protein n=1 Tax=Ktedonobacter sp. SOSP1-52 TaxID=2778366 RepID=UPI0019159670|nr:hypothetical protein [Ktedonobacter sp. SOSP1-52]GHO68579.1 hypothetical protein KSC_074710 [Ktedonobacter sp. SOSP1-52]
MRNRSSYDPNEDAGVYAPPANATSRALTMGVIFGLIGVVLNVIINFLSVPAYANQAREASAGPWTYLALGLGCLALIINIVLCFIAGFITGKRIIVRRPAFWTGVVAVAIIYIASFLLRYIPGYPGNISGQQYSGQVAGGIAVELVILVIGCLFGGIFSQWGAIRATLNHPYYYGAEEEEEEEEGE